MVKPGRKRTGSLSRTLCVKRLREAEIVMFECVCPLTWALHGAGRQGLSAQAPPGLGRRRRGLQGRSSGPTH